MVGKFHLPIPDGELAGQATAQGARVREVEINPRANPMPRKTKAKEPKTEDSPTVKRPYKKRETWYTVELGEEVCDLVAGGKNLHSISLMEGFPSASTMYKWRDEHSDFATKYARACEDRADARAEKIDEITDRMLNGELKADVARVAIDALKWQAGKEKPRRYGDKLTLDGDLTVRQTDDQLDSRLAQLMAKAGAATNGLARIH